MLIPAVVVVMMLALVLVRKQAEIGKEPPKCSGQPQQWAASDDANQPWPLPLPICHDPERAGNILAAGAGLAGRYGAGASIGFAGIAGGARKPSGLVQPD